MRRALTDSAPEVARRRANKPDRVSRRERHARRDVRHAFVAVRPVTFRTDSRQRGSRQRGRQTRGNPESCPALSATFALAGLVTAGSRRQLAGAERGSWEAIDGPSTDVDASTRGTRAQLATTTRRTTHMSSPSLASSGPPARPCLRPAREKVGEFQTATTVPKTGGSSRIGQYLIIEPSRGVVRRLGVAHDSPPVLTVAPNMNPGN